MQETCHTKFNFWHKVINSNSHECLVSLNNSHWFWIKPQHNHYKDIYLLVYAIKNSKSYHQSCSLNEQHH